MKVNKINIEQHDALAIPPKLACNQINTFITNNQAQEIPIVGHNIGFDKGFLSALFDQGESLAKFHHQSEDTLHIWRNLQKAGNVPCHLRANLQTLANYFQIDYTKAHDALADCHITAKVYHNMLKFQ
jgi:DNA polymerase III alpha subunit (gram-positive type)